MKYFLLCLIGVIACIALCYACTKLFQAHPPVYICLTTIPARLEKLEYVLESLLKQTVEPTRILIATPEKSVRFKQPYIIPQRLSEFIADNPKIRLVNCTDDGPATKVLGCIDHVPDNALMVVTDDDHYYHKDLVENLLSSWKTQQDAVHCTQLQKNLPIDVSPAFTGWMARKNIISDLQQLWRTAPSACRYVDDVWFSWCFNKLGIPIKGVYNDSMYALKRAFKIYAINGEQPLYDSSRSTKDYTCLMECSALD